MPHNYNTRLNAKKLAVEKENQLKLEREAEFERLGAEIVRLTGDSHYLGKGAIMHDDLGWRQWVYNSVIKNKCPYR